MPTPTIRVSVTDIEAGIIQNAGNHGFTYPTPVAVAGSVSVSGSQAYTNNTGFVAPTVHPKSHHHE